ATKVLARKASDGVVATGVAYASGGNTFIANVTRDVILAAGSFQSPQLLELSGIGNKALLSGLGIETLLDLPGVGENLQDHLFVATQFQLKPGTLTYDELRINATFAAEQSALYNATGTGLLAGTDSALTFLPFSAFLSAADTQAMLTAFDAFVASTSPSPLAAAQYAIHRSWLEDGNVPQVEVIMWSKGVIDVAANESYITVLGGGVHINSSDGLAHPTINPSFLTNDFDTATVLHALKLAQSTGCLDPLSTIVVEQTAPGALNDTALLSYIRETVSTASHPIGTAAMARRELGGVVDSGLKVYGTTNLRVCDASVFPLSIGTHLQSTVYAVAEKLADVIKTEHSY
ncbi:GMC oxidoreductase-domain-containing protein, partial [Amylostereum chailletii]